MYGLVLRVYTERTLKLTRQFGFRIFGGLGFRVEFRLLEFGVRGFNHSLEDST